MAVDPFVLGPATLSMTQAFTAFNSMLPSLTEIRQHDPADEAFVTDVRMGEVMAAGLALGVGAIASSLTDSSTPVVVAGVMAFGLIMLYETALRANRGVPQEGDSHALG